ncbi:MAG: hypothetical protein LUC43_02235 [Burkholderiales bacterium]|nr:hypothetical protein [Burkholderiales bacterium]
MATALQKERLEVLGEALEQFRNLDGVLKIIDEQQALFLRFYYHYSDFPNPWETFHGIGKELQDAIDIVIEPRN